MKKNAGRLSKKLFAAMMAGTMMTAMIGANVYATGGGSTANTPQNVTITKKLNKKTNVYAPDTDFEFVITPAGTEDLEDGVEAGPANGAYFESGKEKISSEPKIDEIAQTNVTVGTTQISIDTTKFTKPGEYRYVVTEKSGTYEGITYSTEKKYFDVFVNNTTGVYAYTFTDDSDPTGKDDGVFTNDYVNGTGTDDATHNITLKKVVTGEQGNMTDDFTFKVKIHGAEGEKYYVVYSDGKAAVTLTSSETTSTDIYLSNNETATIYGLSASDTYTIEEVGGNEDGYTTTIAVGENDEQKDTCRDTVSGTISADTNITVTNTREASAPTGIAMTYGPYALMVALAGGMAVLFLRRRNREDY